MLGQTKSQRWGGGRGGVEWNGWNASTLEDVCGWLDDGMCGSGAYWWLRPVVTDGKKSITPSIATRHEVHAGRLSLLTRAATLATGKKARLWNQAELT